MSPFKRIIQSIGLDALQFSSGDEKSLFYAMLVLGDDYWVNVLGSPSDNFSVQDAAVNALVQAGVPAESRAIHYLKQHTNGIV
jgi:hypothetical protein